MVSEQFPGFGIYRKCEMTHVTRTTNKFYNVYILRANNSGYYSVVASYGPIGKTPLQQSKLSLTPNLVNAIKEFDKLVNAKKAKGYTEPAPLAALEGDRVKELLGEEYGDDSSKAVLQLVKDLSSYYFQRLGITRIEASGRLKEAIRYVTGY